jgi:(p)ppGpp synthase/HD superfamily hydrolase
MLVAVSSLKGNVMTIYTPHANALRNQALQFAVMAHGNQVRKGNEHIPYVFHCVDVANEVIYYSGLPVEELKLASVIAILHDTVEDTIVTLADIEQQFGSEVAAGVSALTKDESIASPDGTKLSELEENLSRLALAPRYVQAVKLADRVSNLKSFPAMWSREKVSSYLDEAALIARTLGDASEGLHARLLSRVASARVTLSII